MDMFDEARSYRDMMRARGITQKKLAEFLGVSQPYIANKLRLLNFSEAQEREIKRLSLSERHARTILRLKREEDRKRAIERCASGGVSVAVLEVIVESMLYESRSAPDRSRGYRESICDFKERLSDSIALLRLHGIRARAYEEEDENELYIRVKIEK